MQQGDFLCLANAPARREALLYCKPRKRLGQVEQERRQPFSASCAVGLALEALALLDGYALDAIISWLPKDKQERWLMIAAGNHLDNPDLA